MGATQLSAARYYVSAGASASAPGTSWETTTSLTAALARAAAGDEVWVATGTYLPTLGTDRHAGFVVPAGVALFGGFRGTEQQRQQRQPAAFPTVLSGNIGAGHEADDNVYTVITLRSSRQATSVLDGFVIQDGAGRGFTEGTQPRNVGGGLFVAAVPGGQSAHQITNCVFTANRAHNGGAVFINGGSPVFTNCVFTNNKADFRGGAIYAQATTQEEASPVFQNCKFIRNTSNSGAGITNNGANGSSNPLVLNCRFENNYSLFNGAAIFNITGEFGEADPIIENCAFVGNDSVLNDDVSGTGVGAGAGRSAHRSGGVLRPATAKRK